MVTLITGSEELILVSSPKVAKLVRLEWDMSMVKILYIVDAIMLHWGTHDFIG
jgi:hypothetical protein